MLKRFLLLFFVLIFPVSGLFAQERTDNAGGDEAGVPVSAGMTENGVLSEENLPVNLTSAGDSATEVGGGVGWRQVFSLFFGLLLIAFFLFILFRYFKGLSKPAVTPAGGFFRIIASEALFGSRYVHIVKAGSSYYFLASADNEVTLLEKIEDREMIQSIELYVSTMPTEPQTFHERLVGAIQKSKIRVSVDEAVGKISGQVKKQSDKFKKM